MNTLAYLGIYPDGIEKAGDSLDNLMQELHFDITAMDEVWESIKTELELTPTPAYEHITNEIIYTIFSVGVHEILRRCPYEDEIDFNYYINNNDSHLCYCGYEM